MGWRQKIKMTLLMLLEKLRIRERTAEERRLYNVWRAEAILARVAKALKYAEGTRNLKVQRDARRALAAANTKLVTAARPTAPKDARTFIDGLARPPKRRTDSRTNITPEDK